MATQDHSQTESIRDQPAGGERGATLRGRGTAAAIMASFVFPLALTQFIASYAGSNMHVAITNIAEDLGTTRMGFRRPSRSSL